VVTFVGRAAGNADGDAPTLVAAWTVVLVHNEDCSTAVVLQAVVTETRDNLVSDPNLGRSVLSDAELEVTEAEPWLTRMSFGKAVERLVAEDPRVSSILTHVGGQQTPTSSIRLA
jgi:hypothetical protein